MFRPGDRTKQTLKGLDSISDAEKLLRLESREVREYIRQMVHRVQRGNTVHRSLQAVHTVHGTQSLER